MEKQKNYKQDESKITISKNLFIALLAIFSLAIISLVFFLGRESARKESPPQPSQTQKFSDNKRVDEQKTDISISEQQDDTTLNTGSNKSNLRSRPDAQDNNAPIDNSDRESVQSYFKAIEKIQPNQLSGDPNAIANNLVSSMSIGDTSGIDNIISITKDAKNKLKNLLPPSPCSNYHSELLQSLEEGLEIMNTLKKAISSSDTSSLMTIASKGKALQSRSTELARKKQALVTRYGL